MLDVAWEDEDGFVSVSLDSSRCDICNLDTGEDLVPCGICRQEVANAYTRTGFNDLPAHANMQAHKGCLWKAHQTSQQMASRFHNPFAPRTPINSNPVHQRSRTSNTMFSLMTGSNQSNTRNTKKYRSKSQPDIVHHVQPIPTQVVPTPAESPHRRITVGLISEPTSQTNTTNSGQRYSKSDTSKDVLNSKLQRLIRKAKTKETVENRKNGSDLCTRSNPGSRSPSPILIRDVQKQKFGSEKNLSTIQKEAESKNMSLKQRYTKYLFGKSLFSKPKDVFFGKRKQSNPDSAPIKVTTPPTSPSKDSTDSKQWMGTDNDSNPAQTNFRNVTAVDGNHGRGTNNNNGKLLNSGGVRNVELTVVTPVMIVDEPAQRDKEDLFKLSNTHLRDKIEAMSSLVKEISNDLVDLLEERDELRLAVNMRHLMIEKLVAQEKARQGLNT